MEKVEKLCGGVFLEGLCGGGGLWVVTIMLLRLVEWIGVLRKNYCPMN